MARKIVNNSDAGTSTKFGGDDIDNINKYLTGVDQTSTDPVSINTNTTYKNEKLRLRNPADTFSYIYNTSAITADRNITLPALSADDTPLFANQPATITNKTINAKDQTLNGFLLDSTVRRWGSFFCTSYSGAYAGALSWAGAIGTWFPTSFDTTHGYGLRFQSANTGGGTDLAGIKANVITIAAETIRKWNPYMRFKFALQFTTSVRMMAGYTSDLSAIPISDTLISNTASGVFFGFRSTDSNFSLFNNDGGGAMVVTATSTPKDTAIHTVEMTFNDSIPNCTVTFDGSTIATLTTRIPSQTVPLTMYWVIGETAAVNRAIDIYDIYIEEQRQ